MDSDKAIGGLYLDADDFFPTGFLCHWWSSLSWKREESPILFPRNWQPITITVCLYMRLTDCLLYLHALSTPFGSHYFPCTVSIYAAKGEQTVSQLDSSVCMKPRSGTWSWLSWCKRKMGSCLREQIWNCVCVSLNPALYPSKALLSLPTHSLVKLWDEIVFLILSVRQCSTLYTMTFNKYASKKIKLFCIQLLYCLRDKF